MSELFVSLHRQRESASGVGTDRDGGHAVRPGGDGAVVAGDAMMKPDRDILEEALAIVDGPTLLQPERAHLVALHQFHKDVAELRYKNVLMILDCEHSHVPDCDTCAWIAEQPEWQELQRERREEAERNARDAY